MEDKRTFGQKMDEFLMKDSTFILLVIGAAAAIFGRNIYVHQLRSQAHSMIFQS